MKALSSKRLRIHEEAFAAARNLENGEARLIDSLIPVVEELLFLDFGRSSLYVYCRKDLKLSEAVAYNAIAVTRKVIQVPELQTEIRSGAIGISVARKFASVLTRENHAEWIEKAKSLPCWRLEKEVARVNPKAATPELARYVSGDRLSLALGVSEELMLKLRRAQDQVSRSKGKAASLEETIAAMTEFYLHRKDPVERAKRVIAKKGTQNLSKEIDSRFTRTVGVGTPIPIKEIDSRFTRTVGAGTPIPTKEIDSQFTPARTAGARTPIPAAIEHQVRLRDQDQCQYPQPGGGVCSDHRWIDLHHIIPIANGGTHTFDNITTLCQAHHREVHRAHDPA